MVTDSAFMRRQLDCWIGVGGGRQRDDSEIVASILVAPVNHDGREAASCRRIDTGGT